jgi:hypothetical protein
MIGSHEKGITVIADVANAHYAGEEVPETIEHPKTGEVIATMRYVSTDAWRGYWEAVPADGWQKVGEGSNCGSWDDAPPGTSDDEVEAKIRGLAKEYGDVVVIPGGSSNVFSMTFDVLARGEAPAEKSEPTYRVKRFYHDDRQSEVQRTGLTREEAVAHCEDPATATGDYFDGFEEER